MQRDALTTTEAHLPETAPVLKQPSPLAQLAKGFALPFRAMPLIAKNPALLKLSLVTAAISAALLLVLGVLLVAYTGDLVGVIWAKPSGWLLLLWYPLAVLGFGLLFVLGASTVPTVATAPMLDPLSLATERALAFPTDESGGLLRLAKETMSAVGKALLRLALLYTGHAFLLLLWLLPGVGHAVWSILALFWTVFWLAYEYLDVPANRHGLDFGDVLRLVFTNFAMAMGFGFAVYVILWIPLLNTVFIPVAAVGATMGFVELKARGVFVEPPRRAAS